MMYRFKQRKRSYVSNMLKNTFEMGVIDLILDLHYVNYLVLLLRTFTSLKENF